MASGPGPQQPHLQNNAGATGVMVRALSCVDLHGQFSIFLNGPFTGGFARVVLKVLPYLLTG